MLSKSQIAFIQSLQNKKYRRLHKLFVVEGKKSITDLAATDMELYELYTSKPQGLPGVTDRPNIKVFELTQQELNKLSALDAPQDCIALFKINDDDTEPDITGRTLVLDNIQDPGNTGTLIRSASWFGIRQIVCSIGCADVYNRKVVQASMGTLGNVKVYYRHLNDYLAESRLPIYGLMLDGSNIYAQEWPEDCLVMLGNEGKGVAAELQQYITGAVTIPRVGKGESLNVGVTGAIVMALMARQGQ